jgi:hypothetical protein
MSYVICSEMSVEEIFDKAFDQETLQKYPFLSSMSCDFQKDIEIKYIIETYDELKEYFQESMEGYSEFDWDDEDNENEAEDREGMLELFEEYNQYLKKDDQILYIVEFDPQAPWEADFMLSLGKIDGVICYEQ